MSLYSESYHFMITLCLSGEERSYLLPIIAKPINSI